MFDLLEKAKTEAKERLKSTDPNAFKSLYVDYHKPYVERMWFQFDKTHRVFLHHVLPCSPAESLFHPHPWPSIVQVLDTGNGYEHGMGFETVSEKQYGITPAVRVIERIDGHCGFTYDMPDPSVWHYVSVKESLNAEKEVIGSFSLMVTGKPFTNTTSSPRGVSLHPLSEERLAWMKNVFDGLFNGF